MENSTLKPNYRKIKGILFPAFQPDNIAAALNYKPKPDDVFIVTYPKCGTTWMQNIVLHIFRKGKELDDPKDFHKYSPFIECHGMKSIEDMPRPGAFKTHLPYSHVPYFPDAKYIYVLRNPKDCCVSMYYHTIHGHKAQGHPFAQATFDHFFELFMSGEVEYNDYFDHLMSWYPHRYDKQVFYTTYEHMKEDSKSVVLKTASFLGQEYIEAIQKDNNILNNILHFSGFDYMKEYLSEAFRGRPKPKNEESEKIKEKITESSDTGHMRKGVIGDWKNHFTKSQNERMDAKFIERVEGTEFYEMYKPYMFA